MDTLTAINQRRTIRSFKAPATEEQLRRLLLAGVRAPSGSNVQPWEFIVIDDPATISQIAGHKYLQGLKMVLDAMALNDPPAIERIYTGALDRPLSTGGAERQRNAYRNCTVVAVCNAIGHGIGRKPWMNVENIASTWMAVENIMLAATAEGLGVQISILREEHKIAVEKLLQVPPDYELATMIMIGAPADALAAPPAARPRRPDFSWLHRDRFGEPVQD